MLNFEKTSSQAWRRSSPALPSNSESIKSRHVSNFHSPTLEMNRIADFVVAAYERYLAK
jgi:hypothetical protein